MKKNFLEDLPWLDEMSKKMNGRSTPSFREVNGHIHTPYSFSAFDKLDTAFSMARDENISVLGINDFFVTDGYDEFAAGCRKNRIFPLFNIEFIGLLKEEQKKGIRINDPNNPGRIYFSGKGLDYPFDPGFFNKQKLKKLIASSQDQIKAMIGKLNGLIGKINPSLSLSYEEVKRRFARDLVRERHLAKAIRHLANESFDTEEKQMIFIEGLYGQKSKTGMSNPSALENEIRSNLLKAGGAAFVEEDEESFLELDKIIKIINEAGGIPCYPVLLDDANGKFTEFESDSEKLLGSLRKLGIACIELIPGRNDSGILKKFVEFFHQNDFVILLGTEHNTPEMIPLKVTARGNTELDASLKAIAWEGACVVAAHQYLRAKGRQGFVLQNGRLSHDEKDDLTKLGRMVIEYSLI